MSSMEERLARLEAEDAGKPAPVFNEPSAPSPTAAQPQGKIDLPPLEQMMKELSIEPSEAIPESVVAEFKENIEKLQTDSKDRDIADALKKVSDILKDYERLADVYIYKPEQQLLLIQKLRNLRSTDWQNIQDNITPKQLGDNLMADVFGDLDL